MNFKHLNDLLRGEKDKSIRADIIRGYFTEDEGSVRDIRDILEFFVEYNKGLERCRHVSQAGMCVVKSRIREGDYGRAYEAARAIMNLPPMTPIERIQMLNQIELKQGYKKPKTPYGANAERTYDGSVGGARSSAAE